MMRKVKSIMIFVLVLSIIIDRGESNGNDDSRMPQASIIIWEQQQQSMWELMRNTWTWRTILSLAGGGGTASEEGKDEPVGLSCSKNPRLLDENDLKITRTGIAEVLEKRLEEMSFQIETLEKKVQKLSDRIENLTIINNELTTKLNEMPQGLGPSTCIVNQIGLLNYNYHHVTVIKDEDDEVSRNDVISTTPTAPLALPPRSFTEWKWPFTRPSICIDEDEEGYSRDRNNMI